RHYHIFDISRPSIAKTNIKHTIRTGNAGPINSRPFPMNLSQQKEITKITNEMLASKQVRPSNSPWSSPVLLVKKKDGTVRFVVDYRKLNNVTTKDTYPIPNIEQTLNRLNRNKYFTKLDLKSGYYQIPIQEQDKQKTAFITTTGLYEFNDHIKHIEEVLVVLKEANLQLNPPKCSLFKQEMDYLGHTVTDEDLKPLVGLIAGHWN
ncbi:unnamed protein product, partial [Didymodactylos carnosus]